MDLLFDASIHLNDSLSAELLASRYKRVSPVLEEAINLDDWQDATKIAAEIAAWPTTRPEYWRALSAFVKENFID